jgi:ATP-dependent DNA helicase PIF1
LRNLNPSKGLCNGTRLLIKNFKPNVIEAVILSKKNCSESVFLPKITLHPNEDDSTVQFNRKQFPIKLAFALTINKSQGQTIKKVALYSDSSLFSHGHLYTAISRVTSH